MLKYTDEYLDRREEVIKKRYEPIKFDFKVPKTMKMGTILKRFFDRQTPTYTLNGEEQCSRGRARSLIDAYNLLRYYRKDISYKEMYNYIYNKETEANSKRRFGRLRATSTCSTIRRAVIHNNSFL